MKTIRLTNVVLILSLLLSMSSCDRFNGSSKVAKPTQVVDFPSMVGKSLVEMTTMLGQATERCPTCSYTWELPEGELSVGYELREYSKRRMSSIEYKLKPDLAVDSPEEMMALLNINVQGKETKEDRRGFFTYQNITVNDKSGFIDVHPHGKSLVFGQQNPKFSSATLYIQNPYIYFYSSADLKGKDTIFYEQQTDVNLSVGSVLLGSGHWEVCTGANFTGKCKTLDGIAREYLENGKNFSAFGLGNTIKSVRPVKGK
jgi:hypothetical protein